MAAVLIGVSLGMIGGGGSILTVPVLVYMLHIDPVPATAYSLFVVGLTSLVGSVTYMKKNLVSYKTALVFAVPAFIAVYLTRRYIMPAIPPVIIDLGSFHITRDILIMVLFAVLMVLAAISMIKNKRPELEYDKTEFNYPLIITEGFIVGVLTGLVGAGGGFLIIPALVILAKLPMKMAVGTSLLIIAAKSLLGFLGDIGSSLIINWTFLAGFSVFAVSGIFIGSYLTRYVTAARLKPVFGWFVLVMGSYILVKELFF